MRRHLRSLGPGASFLLLGDLITSSLLPLVMLTSMLASSYVSLVYSNLCRAGLGLGLSAWLTYITDLASETNSQRSLSLPHLGAAALTLFLFPSSTRTNTYTIYWAIICLRPLTMWLVFKFPQSFSFGEATLICQSVILFSASLVLRLLTFEELSMKTVIIQLAKDCQWLVNHLLSYRTAVLALLVFWMVMVCLSVAVVVLYHKKGWSVNTRTRKLFHLSVVLVYVSGLLYCPMLLYISSIAAFVLMLAVEAVRCSKVFPPASDILTQSLQPFLDSKDSGSLILTNIYLLVGVSWPLWVYPAPLAVQPAPLVLYSGVISVGIADSAASVVGSTVGRIKWSAGTDKTVEGSLAAVISSLGFVWVLSDVWGVTVVSWGAVTMAVLGMVVTEALSKQVDNLTLPLVMYGLLLFAQYKQF